MPNRNQDACYIQNPGASNPSGVARTLVKALDECQAEGVDRRADPAVRLIAHQLAHLLNLRQIDDDPCEYGRLCAAVGLSFDPVDPEN